jgi:WD40-like Beta Propeller Repeat
MAVHLFSSLGPLAIALHFNPNRGWILMGLGETDGIGLGEFLGKGGLLFTREAVAIVAEVCRQLFYATDHSAPDVDEIRIYPDGTVTVSAGPPCTPQEQMVALADLLETVLPPLGSNEPGYTVRASLRMLAPRARGRAGLPPIEAPEMLGAALGEHVEGEPDALLRGLWARADRALHQYLSSAGEGASLKADAARAAAQDFLGRHHDTPQDDPVMEPAAATITSTVPRHAMLPALGLQLLPVLLFALGFAGGEWLGEQAFEHSTASPSAADLATPKSQAPPAARAPLARASDSTPHHLSQRKPSAAEKGLDVPRPLDLPNVRGPAFSPSFADNGRELVFHMGRDPSARLVSAQLAPEGYARSVMVLSDDRARSYHARRSPDGRFVAFDSDRDGERAVYVTRSDWSDVRRVSGPGLAALPTWSPNMKWLAFVRGEPGHTRVWNLWLREIRTGAMKRLTNYRFGQTWNASWFPDSQLVCYSHEDRLVVLDITTRAARAFRSPRQGHLVRTPAVSPDGTLVLFQVYKDGVWLLDLSSGSMRRVLDDPSAEEFAWSPDGTRVAYHSHRDGSWRIWLMPAPA